MDSPAYLCSISFLLCLCGDLVIYRWYLSKILSRCCLFLMINVLNPQCLPLWLGKNSQYGFIKAFRHDLFSSQWLCSNLKFTESSATLHVTVGSVRAETRAGSRADKQLLNQLCAALIFELWLHLPLSARIFVFSVCSQTPLLVLKCECLREPGCWLNLHN